MSQDEHLSAAKLNIDPFSLFAGACSAVTARLLCHPLDTIRVRVQTHPSGVALPRSVKGLVGRPIVPKLYAGLPVALGFSVPALSIYLTTYETAKRFYSHQFLQGSDAGWLKQGGVYLLAGLTSEMVSGVIWTPMDVAKTRLQRGRESHSTPARTLLAKVWRDEGIRGLFRGYWVSIAVFGPQVGLYWAFYEAMKTRFIPNYSPQGTPITPSDESTGKLAARYAMCSSLSMATAAAISNPLDVIRTRWQTSGGVYTVPATPGSDHSMGSKMTLREMVSDMWRKGGAKAFLRGSGMRVIYYIPSNAISMTTFEMLKRHRGDFGW